MSSKSSKADWNELQYISWKEFKKMVPSIIRLEASRIDKLIDQAQPGSDIYNALIKARYELNQFVVNVDRTNSPPLPDTCISQLSNAILNLSFKNINEETSKIIHYILDRLNYVYNRIGMIYW